MDLCMFISDIKHLQNYDDVFEIISKPSQEYMEVLDTDLIVNQTSLTKLKKYFDATIGPYYKDYVERIYFGAETCELLIPTLQDVEKAYNLCIERELGFTLVTPYGGPKAMKKIKLILDFLKDKEDIEVVVNDFGVLHLLFSEYKSLIPIVGRLLIKQKRDPRFSISGYDVANKNIKNKSKVEKNQNEALQNSSFENKLLQKFLMKNGVSRLSVDSVPQGFNKKILKRWELPVDLFWPWTYITSGRNCAIAAYTDTSRSFYPTEKPCQKQCKMYEFRFESDKRMLPTVQRGNSIWLNSESLYEDFFKAGFERLIYMPYIPI